MYLEKARNVSDLSYKTPASVMQLLSRPVPPDGTALVSLSCHFPLHSLSCLSGFCWVSGQSSHPLLSSDSSKVNSWLTKTVKHGQQ